MVRNVRRKCGNIPIVMHGGSGVSTEDYHKAVEAGVRKINYFTYMDKAGGNAVADYLAKQEKKEPIFFSAMKENVQSAMQTFALVK